MNILEPKNPSFKGLTSYLHRAFVLRNRLRCEVKVSITVLHWDQWRNSWGRRGSAKVIKWGEEFCFVFLFCFVLFCFVFLLFTFQNHWHLFWGLSRFSTSSRLEKQEDFPPLKNIPLTPLIEVVPRWLHYEVQIIMLLVYGIWYV